MVRGQGGRSYPYRDSLFRTPLGKPSPAARSAPTHLVHER
jgi:hypothetical protein